MVDLVVADLGILTKLRLLMASLYCQPCVFRQNAACVFLISLLENGVLLSVLRGGHCAKTVQDRDRPMAFIEGEKQYGDKISIVTIFDPPGSRIGGGA